MALRIESEYGEGDKRDKGGSVSSKKLAANRQNAQLSTGPKTEGGKTIHDGTLSITVCWPLLW